MSMTDQGSQYIYVASGCLYFDGTSDYVTVSNSDYLSVGGSLAFGLWFKLDSNISQDGYLLRKGSDWSFLYDLSDGEIDSHIGLNGDNANISVSCDKNKWQHIMTTWDGTTSVVYMDGDRINSTTGTAPIDQSGDDLYIGSRTTTENEIMGWLHDIRIYSGNALSDTDVKKIYNGINITDGLVGHWKFNDNNKTTATDTTSYDHDGTINGATSADRGIRCWNSRWDEGNWDMTVETFMDPCDRNYLMDNVTPGAVSELYNILGTPKYIDTTWRNRNTLIFEPISDYGLSSLRQRRKIGVRNITDSFITPEVYFLKIEGRRLDIE